MAYTLIDAHYDVDQDLHDVDTELLVLGAVILHGAMQPGHVEARTVEAGSVGQSW